MNKLTAVMILPLLVLLLAIPTASWSEPQRGAGSPPGMSDDDYEGPYDGPEKGRDGQPGGPPSKERMEQVRKRVEMVRIWKLTEVLDLDQETADRLFPILRKYDRKRMELQRERGQLRRQIRQMESGRSGEKVDAEKLLEGIENTRTRMMEIEEQQNRELKKVLTPEQMVKYISFEERFRREMKRMMRESRAQGKQGSAMRGSGTERYGGGGPGSSPRGMKEDEPPMQRRRR